MTDPDGSHLTRDPREAMMCRCRLMRLVPGMLAALLLSASRSVAEDSPLHVRIDEQIAAVSGTLPLNVAGDAEFLRRASLHLKGMPPKPEEVREFVADQTPEKRTAVIDRLLVSPQHHRRMAEFLDVTLMERRANTNIPQDEWMAYLVQSARANKPWHDLAREVLTATGADDDPRAAARFVLDRASEPNQITRDVGRVFFGRDLQCAQCHDHPLIDDYLQVDYHGLYSFFAAGSELKIKQGDKERAYYAERAGSDAQYESVFNKGVKHLTGARVIGGVEIVEPVFLPGEEYTVAPADNVVPEPKFSRRTKLTELIVEGRNRQFNENIANRLWALMMGRGLVHPVDLHHSSNPPAHPALLAMLGEQIAAMGYDMRAFLRELALTRVYQRSYDVAPELFAPGVDVAVLEQNREELAAAADAASVAFHAALDQWNAAQAELLPAVAEYDSVRVKYVELLKKRDEARKAANEAEAKAAAQQAIAATVGEAATKAQAAAAALPKDEELAAAAQKFVDRTSQLNTEVEKLKAAAAEKASAVAAPQAELDGARPGLEAAQQNTEPFRQTVRDAELKVRQSRTAMIAAYTALEDRDARIETAKRAAESTLKRAEAVAAAEQVAKQAAVAAAAAAEAADIAAVVAEEQLQLQAAEEALAAMAGELAKLQQQHAAQGQSAEAVTTAVSIVGEAQAKVPEDAALKQALDLLQSRSSELSGKVQALASEVETAASAHQARTTAMANEQADLAAAQQKKAELDQRSATASEALQAARTVAAAAASAADEAEGEVAARRTRDFLLAELQPLSPEELCWSIFRVTGVYERHWQAQAAEVEKAEPLTDEIRADAGRMAARTQEIEQRTYDQLKSNITQFTTLFGNGAGQPQTDFFATADQALFVANGGAIAGWVAPAAGNITERIINEADPQKAADDLYVSVLSRSPSEAEIADVAACLSAKPEDRAAAARELVWGLISSAEFRFNH